MDIIGGFDKFLLLQNVTIWMIHKIYVFSGYGDDYDAEDDYESNEDEANDSPKAEEENNIYKDMEKHTRFYQITSLLIS